MTKDFEALQLAKECMTESGKLYHEKNLSEATTLLLRARDIFLANEEYEDYLSALRELSFVYFALGQENEEVECYVDAIECATERGMYDMLASFYLNFGYKFQSIDDDETALYFYEKSRDAREMIVGEFSKESAYNLVLNMNMATLYLKQNNLEKAAECVDAAGEAVKLVDNEEMDYSYRVFYVAARWKLGYHDEVRACLDEIVELAKNLSYITDYTEVMSDICNLLRDMGEFGKLCDVLQSMERFTSTEDYTYRLMMCEYWQEYFLLISNHDAYCRKCIEFAEITKEKAKAEKKARAEMVSLSFKSRMAAKDIENSANMMYRDPLTGIFNRNKMMEDSLEDIEKSYNNSTYITIGLIDIDFFKLCNDTYGHIKGDECLKAVASVIQEEVAPYGRVYRFGGDELLILLTEIQEPAKVVELGKKIKERIDELNFPNINSMVADHVTVSQGYTMAMAEPGDKIEDLIQKADKALYEVKRNGRNDYLYKKISAD